MQPCKSCEFASGVIWSNSLSTTASPGMLQSFKWTNACQDPKANFFQVPAAGSYEIEIFVGRRPSSHSERNIDNPRGSKSCPEICCLAVVGESHGSWSGLWMVIDMMKSCIVCSTCNRWLEYEYRFPFACLNEGNLSKCLVTDFLMLFLSSKKEIVRTSCHSHMMRNRRWKNVTQ